MTQQTNDKKWFDQLVMELRLRQVHGSAIGDTIASTRELLGDTGQRAEERSGQPETTLPRLNSRPSRSTTGCEKHSGRHCSDSWPFLALQSGNGVLDTGRNRCWFHRRS